MNHPRPGGGNPAYNLGVHSSNPTTRDASPNRGTVGFVTPQAPLYPTQPTPAQLPLPPPIAPQRVGLLPHPVGFLPPPPALLMQGGIPPPPPPSQFLQGPPPLLPQPGELGGITSLTGITATVSSLGFPASCNFVLGLLQSYFNTSLASTDTNKPPSQLTRDNLQTLVDLFVVFEPRATSIFPGGAPVLSPLNEVQLLLSIHGQLENQQSMELAYCIFDAIFGSLKISTDTPTNGKFDLLKRLVSFATSAECPNLLNCTAVWMRFHPTEAAALVKALYNDFCILLPDAHGPLLQLPTTSPHFAQQLALSFTSLHPFHSVIKTTMDSSLLNPPIRMLQIVYHWLSTYPNLLSPPPLLSMEISELPLVHSSSMNFDSEFPKPVLQCLLPGLMQWCVLAPLCPNYPTIAKETESKSNYSKDSDEPMDTSSSKLLDNKDMQIILTSLHADLLSSILSLSKSVTCQMSGKEMAVLIANLLGYYSHRKQRGEEEVTEKMEECVERLAQLLQISLSSGLLNLRSDDVSGLASTLPKNRLLQLVIARAQQQI